MPNRFLPALPSPILSKAGLFFVICFLSTHIVAQTDSIEIAGYAQPTCGCNGYIDITVTGVSPNQPPSTAFFYKWSNGSTSQDIFNLCPGQYCVTVSNGNINGSSAVQCFFVQQIPYVPLNIQSSNTAPCNFDSTGVSNDCEKACPGTTITYSVSVQNPNGSGSAFNWQVSGAVSWVVNTNNSPFFSSITVTWGGPGTGSVSVFSDGAGGCSGEDALCVTVIEAPNAAFSSSPAAIANGPLQVCLGQTVHFQNLSTGSADSYEWLFRDDFSSSSLENPQHTYLIPGTHTVLLIARSECQCSDTTTLTVEVLNAQAPTLECVSTICPGETVTYTASNGCAPFSWAVSGDGTVLNGGTTMSDTISVQWNGGPVGTITLGAQACSGVTCPLAGVIEIPIITNNAQIVGEERVCPAATEIYTIEPFGGTGFVWTLPNGGTIVDGQGTNRVTVEWSGSPNPAPAADHTLYVQYTNCYLGCGGADFIHVRILPSFTINGPVEACLNSNASFASKLTTNGTAMLCNWTLTAPNGSTAWSSSAPTSAPSVPFLSGPGVYRLLATPVDVNQTCSNDADWAISVRTLPADPTGITGETNICPGMTYTYEATGLPVGSNIRWTVQNGPGAPQAFDGNPLNVTWGNAGPYVLTAVQVSTDGLGCLSNPVGLVATPIPAPVIAGTAVVCEDTKGSYAILNLQNIDIQWSISPATAGTIADGQGTNTVEIFWSQAGSHVVNVSVCSQSASLPITVWSNPDPVVQLPVLGVCPGASVLVQTVSPYASYLWKDESGANLSTAMNITLGAGVYSIEVMDANGCKGASAFNIESWDAPDVTLTTADPTGFCNNSYTVSLTALTNTNGTYTYQWFQDGNLLAGAAGATLFSNQYGNYTVQATNSFGCTAIAGPVSLFSYCGGGGGGCGIPLHGNPYCTPGSVQLIPDPSSRCDSFRLVLNDYTGLYIPGSAQWVTGISGGAVLATAMGDDARFVYPNAGKYIVLVTVYLSNGDICEALDSVNVAAVARLDERVGCPGSMTLFENRSEILPNTSLGNYAWNFDDPASGANNISSLENPAHAFSPAGIYGVNLTVTASSGCTASITKQIKIPDSSPPVFANPAAKCAGDALEFMVAFNPDIIDLNWDFGDSASGTANDAKGNPVYHGFPAGTYTVTATTNNLYGCTASFTRSVTIQPSTLSGSISPANPAPICEGSNITLTAPAGAVSYLWSDGSNTTSQTLTTGLEGTYKVTLTDAYGCTYSPAAVNVTIITAPDALIKALLFNELGQVISNSYPSVTLCAGEDVALQAISNGGASYAWSGGNGMEQGVFFTDSRNNLLPVGTHLYTVTVTSSSTGCTAVSDPFLVTVNPVPTGFYVSSPSICAGNPNVIAYSGPTPANWQFFWNTGVSGTTLTTENPGSYYIRVINEFGCEATSNTQVILPGPPVGSIPAGCHTRCSPDTLCIPVLPNIASWQWFLNGSPIPGATSPNFIAQQSGTYWAQLTDFFGCTGESDPLSLSLYTGYGNILGQVWSDVNNNGSIDAADTQLSGITVLAYQNGSLFGAETSGTNGDFALTNVLSTNYSFTVDPFSLPPNWSIVIGNDQTALSGCDVTGYADFLLHFSCSAFGTLQLKACPGGFATYNGTNISVGGTQIFQLTSPSGCDSTLLVSVVALTPSSSSLTLSACPGSSAVYLGTNIPAGSTRNFTLTNVAGCDSVVTVTVLGDLLPSSSALQVGVCPGETVVYQGSTLTAGTVQLFTLNNAVGCDSMVTVTVFQKNVSTHVLAVSVCPGSTYIYDGTTLAPGDSKDFHYSNWESCDSTVTVTVSEYPKTIFGLNSAPSCSNTPTGILEVMGISGGPAPFRFSLDNIGFQDSSRFTNLVSGMYTVYIQDSNDCIFEQQALLPSIPKLDIQVSNVILPCDSALVQLEAKVLSGNPIGLQYQWWNGGREITTIATEAGSIWVEVTNECETVHSGASVKWAELAEDQDIVYIPNVFMPGSNDLENTQFKPFFAAGITLLNFHFEVFDRWGDKLFETSSISDGWGGTFRDHDFNPGVQVWHLEADIALCGSVLHVERKGDVTVVR